MVAPMKGTRLRKQELKAIRSDSPKRYNASYGRSIKAYTADPASARKTYGGGSASHGYKKAGGGEHRADGGKGQRRDSKGRFA